MIHSHIYMAFITDFHKQGNDTYILMNSPALKLILAFKITCILRSSVDRYGGQVLRRRSRQVSSFILIVYFGVLLQWKNTHVLNFTYNAIDDVVACLLYYTVVILYMTSSTPECFRRSRFWGVTEDEVALSYPFG